MSPLRPALVLLSILLAAPVAQTQELSPRVGLAAFATLPASKGAALYDSGWKLSFSIHVRREEVVEGRVRMEVGEFPAGKGRLDPGATITVQRARTRLVGYDWLIPLGAKGPTGLDVILGIGGVHWFTDTRVTSLPNNPYPFSWSYSDSDVAFASTLGLRYRLARHFTLEAHHVFTFKPANGSDFSDGELSHTSIGIGYRF